MWHRWILAVGCSLLCLPVFGQRTYNTIARDTIITRRGFPAPAYLLDGKRLNLQVMEFFMADHPAAYASIKGAILTDQLSVAGYSIGGLLLLGGILIGEDNASISRDLYLYGGIGLGAGFLSQIISGNFRKNAVNFYNQDIKAYYRDKNSGVRLELTPGRVGVRF